MMRWMPGAGRHASSPREGPSFAEKRRKKNERPHKKDGLDLSLLSRDDDDHDDPKHALSFCYCSQQLGGASVGKRRSDRGVAYAPYGCQGHVLSHHSRRRRGGVTVHQGPSKGKDPQFFLLSRLPFDWIGPYGNGAGS
eukprot:scaffold33622_cov107-Amphora_coffeaeformis.AAC.1